MRLFKIEQNSRSALQEDLVCPANDFELKRKCLIRAGDLFADDTEFANRLEPSRAMLSRNRIDAADEGRVLDSHARQ